MPSAPARIQLFSKQVRRQFESSLEAAMSLIGIIVVLIVLGVALYLINTLIPMDSKIKYILNIVFVIVIILWLLNAFGLFESFPSMLGSLG